MSDNSSNNKRIAKNTMLLYIRMFVTMAVSLYTSRVVLNTLGVDDFGIYNVLGSVIVAFSFISVPLGSATQRFYNYELGKNNRDGVNSIYNHSLAIYIILASFMFLIIGIGGYWFIENKMLLPEDRLIAAEWTFLVCLLTFVVGLLKIPYESMIIANERMNFYAYMAIADVLLKMLFVLSLVIVTWDKLVFFAFGNLCISIICNVCMMVFCHKEFCYVKLQIQFKKETFKSLLSFSGWSLFGSFAVMTQNQGINIMLNTFYGVVINAAMGIATQVSNAINQFVANFQIAYRPQLVKYYAAGDMDSLRQLITNTSKYSYLLLFALVCPICFNIDFILKIWLGNPPELASAFCICMLVYALLETLSAPMWMTVQATGVIRNYQLIISSVILLNIILAYILLKIGFPAITVLIIKCFLDLIYLIVRLIFMRNKISYSIKSFINEVVSPILLVSFCSIVLMFVSCFSIEDGWLKLFASTFLFFCGYFLANYHIVLDKQAKIQVIDYAKSKLNK